MAKEIIRFSNIQFQYPNATNTVLHDCSFAINQGDRAVIKGESGKGKTTLFRLILGFEKPDAGSILYKGSTRTNDTIKDLRRHSAWLPQDLNLGSGKVKDVLFFPFEFEANTANKPEYDHIFETFNKLRLSDTLLQKDFTELSTGQRQRVGIALCYLLHKPLILLDEPTSALDERSKQRVADLLFKDKGRTIFSTSHDPWWVERCGKVVEMH